MSAAICSSLKRPANEGIIPLPDKDDTPHFRIRGRRSAGKSGVREYVVQVGRNLLQSQVVVFVAMRASHRVEMLPFRFLRCQRWNTMTSCHSVAEADRDSKE